MNRQSPRYDWVRDVRELLMAVLLAAVCLAALDYVAVTLGGGW